MSDNKIEYFYLVVNKNLTFKTINYLNFKLFLNFETFFKEKNICDCETC